MPADQLRGWLTKVGWEVAFTTALAQFFRYLAGFSGLFSLAQIAVAVGRGRRLGERLSEWDEAILLAALSAVAQLIVTHIDQIK